MDLLFYCLIDYEDAQQFLNILLQNEDISLHGSAKLDDRTPSKEIWCRKNQMKLT